MDFKDALFQKGFSTVPDVYSPEEIKSILELIDATYPNENLFGKRQFIRHTPGLVELLFSSSFRTIIHGLLPGAFCIKSIYFDKPPQSNWFVSWHQDRSIFVKEKIETVGFKNWTRKENEFGVQPPAEFLGNIITVRIHFDDTDETNGALKVIPYSHSEASARSAGVSFSDSDSVTCLMKAGGIMLMKPLLFHSSSRSTGDKQRRVVHLEFCNVELPDGLEWSQKTGLTCP